MHRRRCDRAQKLAPLRAAQANCYLGFGLETRFERSQCETRMNRPRTQKPSRLEIKRCKPFVVLGVQRREPGMANNGLRSVPTPLNEEPPVQTKLLNLLKVEPYPIENNHLWEVGNPKKNTCRQICSSQSTQNQQDSTSSKS